MGNFFSDLQKARDEQHAAIAEAIAFPETQETRKPETKKSGFTESQETGNPGLQEPRKPENQILPTGVQPYRAIKKATFDLDEQTVYELDELKMVWKRQQRKGITKNELVEAAIEFLKQDYEKNQETSFLVNKFSGNPVNQKDRKMENQVPRKP